MPELSMSAEPAPMSTIKNVAVLMGGWSSEREVSLSSAQTVIKALKELGYTVQAIDVKEDIPALLKELDTKPDVVFNALHGTGGEDGVIQGFLDMLKIPYTHSGVMASSIAMNKILSRRIFEHEGIQTPPWKIVTRESLKTTRPMEGAFVIKPVSDGSSRGIYIVKDEIPQEFFDTPWPYGEEILIEKFLEGRDILVGVMGDRALGAIEIRPTDSFYDYQAKYTPGFAEHLMPAPLSKEDYAKVLDMALRAHKVLGCRGVSRSDFILCDGEFYLLELNSQPGMTPLSSLPEIAEYAGVPFKEMVEYLLQTAAYRT